MTRPEEIEVRLLAPASGVQSLEKILPAGDPPRDPFSAGRRRTLGELSRSILNDGRLRADAASVALGYWLRRAHIDRLARDFEQRVESAPGTVFVPTGRVFHVAPGNVDTVFVYSWALSYLCGNRNLVRVSGQPSEILSGLAALLSRQMDDDAELAEDNRFLTYEHDRATSEALSRWATHRVLWGGDEAVTALREIPLSPHASERTFGSKFSYCVISTRAFLAASAEIADRVAAGFFNDVFWFDQMACSSPHLVVWVGPAGELDPALERFHAALAREIERRGFRGAPSNALHRLNFVFDLACEAELRADLSQKEFLGVRLPEGAEWRKEICGAGLFTHLRLGDLGDVAALCEERDQTITHFGFAEEELRGLARRAGARGVDRLVPIGEALAFDASWDGFDLIGDFLRRVALRVADR